MKIAVYAITKNEEKFVDQWYDSMKEADVICVLDTGSTDRTVELLQQKDQKCGPKVIVGKKNYQKWSNLEEYHQIIENGGCPWRFDVARNDSIDLVPDDCDILVCTDLDEILLPGWRNKLETCWTEYIERNGVSPTTGKYQYVWNFHPDGTDDTVFLYEKVHAKGVAKWAHPVHEILDYGKQERRDVIIPGMRLEHHADPTKSRGQYLNLLELSVQEAPNNDRNCHYLGREYMFYGMWDRCIEILKKHLSLPTAAWRAERANSMRFIAKAYIAKGEYEKAVEWLRRGINEDLEQREAAVDLAQLGYDMQIKDKEHGCLWWAICVEGASRALRVINRTMSYVTQDDCWGIKPYDLLSLGLWYTNDVFGAREAVKMALKIKPNDERLLDNARLMGAI